jgi:hypothetical protein
MCRNIRTLFNFVPPVTTEEIRAASLQFVRKISGFNKPSKANEAVFQAAVDEITEAAIRLIRSLGTTAPPKDRERGRKGEGPCGRKIRCLSATELFSEQARILLLHGYCSYKNVSAVLPLDARGRLGCSFAKGQTLRVVVVSLWQFAPTIKDRLAGHLSY